MNKLATLLLALSLLLPSCDTLAPGTSANWFVTYTQDTIEIHSIQAAGPKDVRGLGYNRKTKVAYLAYADGSTTRLKVIGGGLGNNTFALILEGGARISVDLKTGKVTTTGDQFGGKEPVMPQ
jgi:hypothetical protein